MCDKTTCSLDASDKMQVRLHLTLATRWLQAQSHTQYCRVFARTASRRPLRRDERVTRQRVLWIRLVICKRDCTWRWQRSNCKRDHTRNTVARLRGRHHGDRGSPCSSSQSCTTQQYWVRALCSLWAINCYNHDPEVNHYSPCPSLSLPPYFIQLLDHPQLINRDSCTAVS